MSSPVDEYVLRGGIFVLLVVSLCLLERWQPRRTLSLPRRARWPANLGIALVNRVLLIPLSAIAAALVAERQGWGFFNQVSPPLWLATLASLLLLDLTIYWQHRLFHRIPVLWRLHRMHHADADVDVTTGVRFHPLEAVFSMLIKIAAVIALGAPAATVLLFEIVLNATSLFNHANVRIPATLERALRWVVVTPDMHRVHHSNDAVELAHNFGFNLPWWDRLFGTYLDQPAAGHESMQIGIAGFDTPQSQHFRSLLTHPFRN